MHHNKNHCPTENGFEDENAVSIVEKMQQDHQKIVDEEMNNWNGQGVEESPMLNIM